MRIEVERVKLLTAFAAVYLIWGSTYLAIRFAIETVPPLLMAGTRFLVAGGVLLAVVRVREGRWPARAGWLGAGATGIVLIAAGNGGITWAEGRAPSSIAALVASAVPLWMALVDWARPGGSRPSARTFGGIVLGLLGLFVLIGPRSTSGSHSIGALGLGVLVLGSIAWAAGSVLARHVRASLSPLAATSVQMVVGGSALVVAGAMSGETVGWEITGVSARSAGALAYLIVFGSWVAFSAYVWLLRATTPARASSYAFVNPVVAVLLGSWLASEPVGPRTLLAMAIIVSAVALLVFGGGTGRRDIQSFETRTAREATA
jgi:drug/metabolite transporter (DMT)-like permease